jgi:signal transduction histidine kinase
MTNRIGMDRTPFMMKGAHGLIGSPDHNATYREQVKHLYRLCSIGIATTLVNSFLLIFILRKVISHTVLINWVTAMLLIALFQYILHQIYESSGLMKDEQNRWGTLFHIGVAVSGLFWGSTAIFLFPAESIIHQLFLALITCGMLAMAVGAYSVILDAFLAYCIPAVIPVIIRFLVIGDEIHLTVGGVVLIFSLLMFFAAKVVNSSMQTFLTFRQTNIDEISPLEEEGATNDRSTRLKRKIVVKEEGEEERGKKRTTQWMTGFEQLKRTLRESSNEIVELKVPKMGPSKPDKLSSKSPLLKGIARDFNNLFTYIRGKVSLILIDMGSDQPGYNQLKDLEKGIRKGAELTKQLSKMGNGLNRERITTDLNVLLRKYSQEFGREKEQISFHLRIQDGIWDVNADQEEIDRVIRKVYDDSCSGMPGGGELYVRGQNVTLGDAFMAPHGLEPGKFVKVSVTSTGSGIEEGRLRISGEESTYLHQLIRKNGGILHIYREEGSETTLDLYLPARENGT